MFSTSLFIFFSFLIPIVIFSHAFNTVEWSLLLKKLPIFLIWGGRKSNDLYLDFLKVYKNLNIQYIPVLSRPDNDWFGMKGYVQNILIEQNLDLSEYNIYACGLDKMISNAQELLEANGLNQHSFFSDAFVSSSDIMSG